MHQGLQSPSDLPTLMTIREPVSYYFSLWSYGLDGRGGFFSIASHFHPDRARRMYKSATPECFSWFLDYALNMPAAYPCKARDGWLPWGCDVYTARILEMIVPVSRRADFLDSLGNVLLTWSAYVDSVLDYQPSVLIRTSSLSQDFYALVRARVLDFMKLPSGWEERFPIDAKPRNASKLSASGGAAYGGNHAREYVSDYWVEAINVKSALAHYLYSRAAERIEALPSG
jgi:hypothetical protein